MTRTPSDRAHSNHAHTDLVNAILAAINQRDDARLWKNVQGHANEDGRYFRSGLGKGTADLVGILTVEFGPFRLGVWISIEVKTGNAKPTEYQKMHLADVSRRKGMAIVARSVADATSALDVMRFQLGAQWLKALADERVIAGYI